MTDETPQIADLREFSHDTQQVRENFQMLPMDAGPDDDQNTMVLKSVFGIEKAIHEDGWGGEENMNLHIGALHFNDAGFGFTGAPVPHVENAPFGKWFPEWMAGMTEELAAHWEDDTLPPMLQWMQGNLINPRLWGALISVEGWVADEPDPDTEPEQWADFVVSAINRDLGSHPQKREMRSVVAMDLAQNVIIVTRERDAEPELKAISGDDWRSDRFQAGVLPLAVDTYIRLLVLFQLRVGMTPPAEVAKLWLPPNVLEIVEAARREQEGGQG